MSFNHTVKYSWNKLRFYLSFFLLAFYLFIAYQFLFTDAWIDLLPKGRALIGIVLFLFGLVRFYVAYKRYQHKKARIILSAKKVVKKDEAAVE